MSWFKKKEKEDTSIYSPFVAIENGTILDREEIWTVLSTCKIFNIHKGTFEFYLKIQQKTGCKCYNISVDPATYDELNGCSKIRLNYNKYLKEQKND